MSNKDVYIAKMKLQLDELDAQMAILEARTDEAKEDTRTKCTRKKWPNCATSPSWPKASSTAMKSSTAEAWDATVAEMEKIRDAFTHSFSYFKSQL